MTKAKISEYSATAGNNTDVNGVNIAEGCPPSSMNNMGREIMAALKRYQVGSDGDGVTVGGNLVVSGTATVTSGSINGTTVGATTPATGSFTTLAASSPASFAAGTALLPSITTTGDVNTGIFFPAADNIGFATNGVIRGRWTTDGLCFGTDTAAANALDDYEEGTWTPSLGGNTTYITQTGHYTKVGRLVTTSFTLKVNVLGTGSTFEINDLPFAINAAITTTTGACYFDGPIATSIVYLTGVPTGSGDNKIQFYSLTAAATGITLATIFGNGARVIGTYTYQV